MKARNGGDVSESRELPSVALKEGSEPLHQGGRPIGRTVLDFWRWSASDLAWDATQWRFWDVSSAALHERARGWITVEVAALERIFGASIRYEELAEAVRAASASP